MAEVMGALLVKPMTALVTLAVLLAGCASSLVTDQGPVANESATEQDPVRWLNGSLSATLINSKLLNHGMTTGDSNCLEWEKAQIRRTLEGGQARATWTAETPASARLVIVAGNLRGPPDSIEGSSPLELVVLAQEVADRGFFTAVQAPDPGVFLNQPVRLEWSIPYHGLADPLPVPTKATTIECWIGTRSS